MGSDLRRGGIHGYELCRTTAHSRREITLVFASLAERGSRARFVSWFTDRLVSPTHYKPVQLQYPGGLTGSSIATKGEAAMKARIDYTNVPEALRGTGISSSITSTTQAWRNY